MTNSRQPALSGFEKADAISSLLGSLGLVSDLGALLSEHLLAVLRQQYSDLDIESIEFVEASDCNFDGMIETSKPEIVRLETLSIPFIVNVVVTARKQKYHLNLDVVLNAIHTEGGYDCTSDVRIRDQQFLGAVASS